MKAFDEVVKSEFFQTFLGLWAEHLENKNEPGLLANYLLETMMDPSPESSPKRQMCSLFVNLMASRKWEDMFGLMLPHLPDTLTDTSPFRGADAASFYEGLRSLVVKHVMDYYKSYEEGTPSLPEAPPGPEE